MENDNNNINIELENITNDEQFINNSEIEEISETTTENSQDITGNENISTYETTSNGEIQIYLDNINNNLVNIHNDLQLSLCFIIFFIIVILCFYTYKFFDMFFKI